MENSLNKVLSFYDNLNDVDKELIIKTGRYIKYKKSSNLINNTDECMGLVLIIKGQIRAYTVSEEGKEITLYRLIEGDICIMSASCMLKEITFNISLTFEKDSEIFVIPANIYDELNKKYAEVKSYTLNLVNSRFSEVMWVFEQYVFTKMASRIAALLLEHSTYYEDNIIKITHEDLARDLGTAREVVTRMLKQFEEENLIKMSRGKIEILDIKALSRI